MKVRVHGFVLVASHADASGCSTAIHHASPDSILARATHAMPVLVVGYSLLHRTSWNHS